MDRIPAFRSLIISRFQASDTFLRNRLGPKAISLLRGSMRLAAPGHAPEQTAFYSPAAGVLFAADALNTRDDRLQLTPRRITAQLAGLRGGTL